MKKIFLIIFLVIIIVFGIYEVTLNTFLTEEDDSITLKQEERTIEYGNTYTLLPEELIDFSKYSFIDPADVKIESNILNEEGKNYPAVGEYEVSVNYKKKKLKQEVKVIDTIAPDISIKEKVEIPYNTKPESFDFSEYINISDLSKTKDYNIDFTKVNVSSSGEYDAKISIQDIYDNYSEKEFKIVVKEEEKKEDSLKDIAINKATSDSKDNKKVNTNEDKSISNKTSASVSKNKDGGKKAPASNNKVNSEDKKQENSNYTEHEVSIATKTECLDNKHAISSGNTKKWFDTQAQVDNYYDKEIEKWGKKWENGEITKEIYLKECPSGYQTWTCPKCQKWTLDFYYR